MNEDAGMGVRDFYCYYREGSGGDGGGADAKVKGAAISWCPLRWSVGKCQSKAVDKTFLWDFWI